MPRNWKAELVVAALLAAGVSVGSTIAAHSRDLSAGEPQVKQLLLLMDRNRNGKVSRAEFMRFMAAEFNRLDTDRNGELDVNELTRLRINARYLPPHR